jgi:hypothetical protein
MPAVIDAILRLILRQSVDEMDAEQTDVDLVRIVRALYLDELVNILFHFFSPFTYLN